MDAQTLFRDGVLAIRQNDAAKGQELLKQSLKLDPDNEMAWLWMSRTMSDPQRKLQCLERTLRINPNNEQALALKQKLQKPEPPPMVSPFSAPLESDELPASEMSDVVLPLHLRTQLPLKAQTQTSAAPAQPTQSQLDELRAAWAAEQAEIRATTSMKAVAEAAATDREFRLGRSTDEFKRATDSMPIVQPSRELSPKEQLKIKKLLQHADMLMAQDQVEPAIEKWVEVLDIEPDNEDALRESVRQLWKLGYPADAKELVWKALEIRTRHPSVYLTAIDILTHEGDHGEADDLRYKLALLPDTEEKVRAGIVDRFVNQHQMSRAMDILEVGIEKNPANQKMLLHMATLQEGLGHDAIAQTYYDRVARLGLKTEEGKLADKKLATVAPVMTDRERGSTWLAVREAVGICLLLLMLGWQDAGMNLAFMGAQRWLGVLLGLLGGYLVITATSSTQQKPLASWLGGQTPDRPTPTKTKERKPSEGLVEEPTLLPIIPSAVRYVLGIVGGAVLIVAFTLVFSRALELARNPTMPADAPTYEQFLSDYYIPPEELE